MNGSWILRAATIGGLALSLACFIFLHVTMPHVHPVHQPLSMFEIERQGQVAYVIACAGLTLACAALAKLHRRWLRIALAASAGAFVLTVMFPTDPSDTMSLAGQVHRYASGAAFWLVIVSGAIAAYLLLRQHLGRWMLSVTAVNFVLMCVVMLNTFLPELANGGDWRGVPQRLLLLGEGALLLMLAYAPSLSTTPIPAGSRD